MEYSLSMLLFGCSMNHVYDNNEMNLQNSFWKDIQVSIWGNSSVMIENYKSIVFCSQNEFVIRGYRQKISISGHHISIDNMNEYQICFSGCIQTIKLIGSDSYE